VHAAAIWTIIEIFSDATLLSRVRAELRAADFQSFTTNAAVDKLISLPLLQSIYSEVLRLRVEVQHVLYSNHDEIQINEYRFPRRQIIMVPSGPAHMNADAWNTRDGEHPLDTFWADRFLVYPNDPLSGPARKSPSSPPSPTSPTSPTTTSDPGKPKFKDSSVSDSFIPYGVGERTCPGRFFSKREIIAFCATIVNDYDVDLLTKQKKFEHSPTFYGFGTQRPASRIPFRIRKRKE
jgi:cytochrome P450